MAAKKGNKHTIISNTGSPRKFDSPEQMCEAIDAYFFKCDSREIKVYDKKSESIVTILSPVPYTVEGLCNALDMDRKTLLNYGKEEGYEDFFHTVKEGKRKIQQNLVERGLMGSSNSAVSIFVMKNNFGYSDNYDVNSNVNNITKSTLNDLSLDQLLEIKKITEQER